MKKNILIMGACSGIAQAVCETWAKRDYTLFLVARHSKRLNTIANDLRLRFNTTVHIYSTDFTNEEQVNESVEAAQHTLRTIDYALIAYGTLPNQSLCENNLALTRETIQINAISVFGIITMILKIFEKQNKGVLGVITSVAGDRGRASNYIYGMSKGMLQIALSGLRARFSKTPIKILDIRPGFVNTPMTQHISKKGFLWVSPNKVAYDIVNAFDKQKSVLYTPYFWRWIMFVINALPIAIFNRLKI